jgi:5-carboxymethyl-2-hydroxymuconate isomerase
MPHLILEASINIHECKVHLEQMLLDCHHVLVEKLPTQLTSCTSRVILHDIFVIGDNSPNAAFIHLTIKLLKGRTPELLAETAQAIKDKIEEFSCRSLEHLKLRVSVEIVELSDAFVK